jgi:hypothetical protein
MQVEASVGNRRSLTCGAPVQPSNPSIRYSITPLLHPQHELKRLVPEAGQVFVSEVGIDLQRFLRADLVAGREQRG